MSAFHKATVKNQIKKSKEINVPVVRKNNTRQYQEIDLFQSPYFSIRRWSVTSTIAIHIDLFHLKITFLCCTTYKSLKRLERVQQVEFYGLRRTPKRMGHVYHVSRNPMVVYDKKRIWFIIMIGFASSIT